MTAAEIMQLCDEHNDVAASWDSCSAVLRKQLSEASSDVAADECDTAASSGASTASLGEDSDSDGWTSVAARPRRARGPRDSAVRGACSQRTEEAMRLCADEQSPMAMHGPKAQNRKEVRAGAPWHGDDRASFEMDFHTAHNWSKKSKGSWSVKNKRKVSEQIVRRVEQSCRSRGWLDSYDDEE